MHLITVATARSKTDNTHKECGGDTVKSRIKMATLTMLFKIITSKAPLYLTEVLSALNGGGRHYNFRKPNLRIPLHRVSVFKRSFFPRAIDLWNKLTMEMRNKDSVQSFKSQFKRQLSELQILYFYGERWPSVHHARMRIGCSKLNFDLHFNLHVSKSPACICGARYEDATHFFLWCPRFDNIRQELLYDIRGVMPINAKNLLYGNENFNKESNERVFKAVHHFIMKSERFV